MKAVLWEALQNSCVKTLSKEGGERKEIEKRCFNPLFEINEKKIQKYLVNVLFIINISATTKVIVDIKDLFFVLDYN